VFIAGIVPGILLGVILLVTAIIHARIKNYGRLPKQGWNDRIKKTLWAIPAAFLPVLIIGGIYAGWMTPTESSFVAALYALLVSTFFYREMSWKKMREIIRESVGVTAMIFLIICAAMIFATFLTNEQVPQNFSAWMQDISPNVWIFMIAVNLMFFVLGMFLEATSIILITLPILMPILASFNIDLIHFAIIMTINMELAMITPPVGLNLFVVSGITREKVGEVVKGVIPFFILMVVALALIVIFPEISLWLPGLLK
jgi:C4-dicarboxylate transporter DctM subunit